MPLRRGFIYLCSADSNVASAAPQGHLVRQESRVDIHSVAVCCTKV